MAVPRRPPCCMRLKKASEPEAAQLWLLTCSVTRGGSWPSSLPFTVPMGANGSTVPHAAATPGLRRRGTPLMVRHEKVAPCTFRNEGRGTTRAPLGRRHEEWVDSWTGTKVMGGGKGGGRGGGRGPPGHAKASAMKSDMAGIGWRGAVVPHYTTNRQRHTLGGQHPLYPTDTPAFSLLIGSTAMYTAQNGFHHRMATSLLKLKSIVQEKNVMESKLLLFMKPKETFQQKTMLHLARVFIR